jgi:hypothetical protein
MPGSGIELELEKLQEEQRGKRKMVETLRAKAAKTGPSKKRRQLREEKEAADAIEAENTTKRQDRKPLQTKSLQRNQKREVYHPPRWKQQKMVNQSRQRWGR